MKLQDSVPYPGGLHCAGSPEMPQDLRQTHWVRYLRRQFAVIGNLTPKVSRHALGREVHELRIATRRARAVCWCLRHACLRPPTSWGKLDHSLKRLGDSLGRIRELDVAILDARRFGLETTRLEAKRHRAEIALRKWMNPSRRRKISRRIRRADRTVRKLGPIRVEDALDHLGVQLGQRLERPVRGKAELHQLRVTLKRAEYTLEAEGKPTRPIVRIQTLLGDSHDLQFLQKQIGKNRKVEARQRRLNQSAVPLVKPVIRFAVRQLIGK